MEGSRMDSSELFRQTAETFRREFVADSRLEARDHLRTILAAYAMAGEQPMPTPLVAAIEAAKRYMG